MCFRILWVSAAVATIGLAAPAAAERETTAGDDARRIRERMVDQPRGERPEDDPQRWAQEDAQWERERQDWARAQDQWRQREER
ncbi:MAG TPA: hypothetical protein PK322_14065, partial [Opitutaceae bacterium]|nr:hypothetical protein [Opitutaceae bacterium]